jgi:alpha-1,6-mannosyltransferase
MSTSARYLALSVVLVAFMAARAWTDAWIGDFWIYVATVQELAARPLHPHDPLLGGERPFAFLNPYLLALGLAVRWTGARVFDVLVMQGLINLVLLLGALHAFVAVWIERRSAALYALLFLLFLWGRDPWLYSGFFHFRSLTLVTPYPSVFMTAVALGSLAALPRLQAAGLTTWTAVLLPVSALLWSTHPITALFFALGLAAWSLETTRRIRYWVALAVVLGGGLGLALAWPLYPVGELLFGEAGVVHEGNDVMYADPLPRIAPALLGVPFVVLRLRRNPRDPLGLLAVGLVGLVVYGGLSGQWTYGRLIQHAVLMLQVALADGVAAWEAAPARSRVARRLLAPVLSAVLVATSWSSAIQPGLAEAARRGDPHWLAFLAEHVGRDEIVLTDLETCWYVPGFAGKVVGFPMRLPFVSDHDERIGAVTRFFERGVPEAERRRTIERYHVAYVLFDKSRFADGPERLAELEALGSVVYSAGDYVLLRSAGSKSSIGFPSGSSI